MSIQLGMMALASSVALASVGAQPASRRMADGKDWTTSNLNIAVDGSYCYDEAERNCRRYGRLYTWEAAQRMCRSVGGGWRLPTNDDWQQLAKHYGGVRDASADGGKAAYAALITGGSSGFRPCSAGAARPTVSTHGVMHMASTGRRQNPARTAPGSTTWAEAARSSIDTTMARSRGHSPCDVSGNPEFSRLRRRTRLARESQ